MKVGLLPVYLSGEEIDYLFRNSENVNIEIDLFNQQVTMGSIITHFKIDEHRKKALLQGLDDRGITLQLDEKSPIRKRKNNKVILPITLTLLLC